MNEIFWTHKKIESKEKNGSYIKLFLIGTFIEALLIFVLYIIIFSSFFEVKEIKIINAHQVSEDEVLNFIKIIIFDDSYIKKTLTFKNILIWPNYINNNLNIFYPIKNLYIKKDYFNKKIEILVNERKEIGSWCSISRKECFWFDDFGLFFKKTLFLEGGSTLKIYDYTNQNIGLGYRIDSFKIKIITHIFNLLNKNNIGILEMKLVNLGEDELEVISENGPRIYFSLKFLPPDISNLILDFKKQGVFDKLKYLDLRIENKIYYQ